MGKTTAIIICGACFLLMVPLLMFMEARMRNERVRRSNCKHYLKSMLYNLKLYKFK